MIVSPSRYISCKLRNGLHEIRPSNASSIKHLHQNAQRVVTRSDIVGEVALVNVWATWCAACLVAHPVLLRLAREAGFRIVGVNYNDESTKAVAWLRRHEDPYALTVVDHEGVLGIDLGIYGAPETFVVDATGTIRFRHVGAVTEDVWRDTLGPIVSALREGGDS